MQRTFTRQELYDLVWSTPIVTLAGQFDISDRGLAKTCARHRIPVPGRGYWAKVEAGQPATKTPLWKIDNPDIETVYIGGFIASASPGTVLALEAAARTVKTFRSEEIQPLRKKSAAPPASKKEPVVLAAVERPHDSLSGLARALKSAKRDEYGQLAVPGIRIHERSVARLTAVLHHLVVALIARNVTFTWDEKGLHAAIDRDSLQFEISEGREREKHVPTPDELQKHAAYEKRRDAARRRGQWLLHESFWPEFDYVYAGKLTLEVHNWGNGARKRWSDGRHQTLESMLEAMADGILFHLAFEKARREEREEAERRRAHMAHRRSLHKKRQEREATRLSFLRQLAADQREAADLHSTIAKASELLPDATPEYRRMIAWAEQRLAHLQAQNQMSVLTTGLRGKKLFPEPDDLHDPEGDPPEAAYPWGG